MCWPYCVEWIIWFETSKAGPDCPGTGIWRRKRVRSAGAFFFFVFDTTPSSDECYLASLRLTFVSPFQFAKASGATVITTTSSPVKAEKLKQLGADHVINYKTDPNWGETARKLTGGIGVDHIIEVGGPGTLQQSFKCIKLEGVISVIGFLAQSDSKAQPTVMDTLSSLCTVRGIYVGSKAMMQDMIRAVEANNIHPVVDQKIFSLEQTRDAYEYMVRLPLPIPFSPE